MQIPPYLVNEHYNDRFFDVVDAVEEAKQIYFRGNRIIERLTAMESPEKEFTIGELGFGAGRNVVALIDFLDKSALTGIALHYYSVELHPIPAPRINAILEGFRAQIGQLIDLLVNAYKVHDLSSPGWHRIQLCRPFGTMALDLWIGEALEMVHALAKPCDAWFLDGHGPKKNPSIWRPELLYAIGEKTMPGGTCATFTVSGEIRRNLAAAGFSVEKWPGFGGKKSVLRGTRRSSGTLG
jgi:tRNA 5-methylaminomethyl-2-thiouridine biosynthesis bifunctional protein